MHAELYHHQEAFLLVAEQAFGGHLEIQLHSQLLLAYKKLRVAAMRILEAAPDGKGKGKNKGYDGKGKGMARAS